MKTGLKIAAVLGAMFIVATGCYCVASTVDLFGKTIKGNGKLTTRTISAPKYDAIKASRAVQVVISDKVSNKITIEADDNLMEHVEVTTDEGKLRISMNKDVASFSDIHVKVTVPANGTIRSLDASSAASITSEVTLNADEFEIDASSASKIEASVAARTCSIETSSAAKVVVNVAATKCTLDASSASKIDAVVKATDCEVDASSAAKITTTGNAKRCKVETTSASSFNALDFVVADYTISASSGSSANINCTDTLTASASSGASIRYTGNCQDVTRNMSSGGSVNKK